MGFVHPRGQDGPVWFDCHETEEVAIRIETLHELVSLERLLAQGSHRRPEINNKTPIEAFIDTSEQSLIVPVVTGFDDLLWGTG